jgi:hypothetical protein
VKNAGNLWASLKRLDMSQKVGHAMTCKILCDKSLKVFHGSNLCSAANPSDPNLLLDPLDGENLTHPFALSSQSKTMLGTAVMIKKSSR